LLKLSKEETLVNDDNNKEPTINKYTNQRINLGYQPNINGHVRIRRKTTPTFSDNEDYIVEEDLYKSNRKFLFIVIVISL